LKRGDLNVPANCEWLPRVAEIAAVLEKVPVPVIDRATVEELFSVRRRRAIELMRHWGGFRAGGTFLVERDHLLSLLRAVMGGDDYVRSCRKQERISAVVEKSRQECMAARVRIPTSPECHNLVIDSLPGVHLWPGMLTIEFAESVELLKKLYDLARAIGADFERFQRMTVKSADR